MRKLFISPALSIPNNKVALMGEFCNFTADFLSLSGGFKIFIVDDRQSNGISTTASYTLGDNEIKIYGKNRAIVDILRSIAHELTHMMQDENGILVGKIPDAGGPIEDEANSKAGEIIKRFAKSSTERSSIYERLENQ